MDRYPLEKILDVVLQLKVGNLSPGELRAEKCARVLPTWLSTGYTPKMNNEMAYQSSPSLVKMPWPIRGANDPRLIGPRSKSLNCLARIAWILFGSEVTWCQDPRMFWFQVAR
jgi:hypothetical protein